MLRRSFWTSVRAKITLGFGLILVLLAGIGGQATLALIEAAKLSREFRSTARLAADVSGALSEFQAARLAAEAYLTIGQERLELFQERLKAAKGKILQGKSFATDSASAYQLGVLEAQLVQYGTLFDSSSNTMFLQ